MTLRSIFLASAFLTASIATPVLAQTAAAPAAAAAPAKANVTVGAAVLDTQGGSVGTIASVTGDLAVIDTGTVKASVPTSAFAQSDKGLLMSMTKAQLEAAAKGATDPKEVAALLTPGTAVADSGGNAVGKIDSIDGEYAVLTTPNTKVRLPKTAFAKGPNGLVIGMTLTQLEAAAKGAGPSGS